MSKILTLDEMLECLQTMQHPMADGCKDFLEAVGNMMARAIADKLNVKSGRAEAAGPAFAGTAAPFYKKYKQQRCPSPLNQYDVEEWDLRSDKP